MTDYILDPSMPEMARRKMEGAWHDAKAILELGRRVSVSVSEFKNQRTIEQNAKFHAVCNDLAKSVPWAGELRDVEAWKRLLVDAWARETGRLQGKIVPSLDGHSIVNLSIQTRSIRVDEMSELIEWATAYYAERMGK